MDIRLPCGGSLDVLVSVAPLPSTVQRLALQLRSRVASALALYPDGRVEFGAVGPTGWMDQAFRRSYVPALRLAIVGRGLEFEAVLRLAAAAGYEVEGFAADDASIVRLAADGIDCWRLETSSSPIKIALDAHTAVLLLFHDHEWELPILEQALLSDCLYIGALGSRVTHRRRCDQLLARGHGLAATDRIRGPIGLFGPTRDASSLAISVLAELAQLQAMPR
jgi:xanthine dehydrogenase accessory factor